MCPVKKKKLLFNFTIFMFSVCFYEILKTSIINIHCSVFRGYKTSICSFKFYSRKILQYSGVL